MTSTLTSWLRLSGVDVVAVNLDPGAMVLPYTPDVDVRDYVRVEDLMRERMLGPNGAMVLACDMLSDYVDDVREEVESVEPDLVVVDTPGQMELFAFRDVGPYMVEELGGEKSAVLYIFDALFSKNPLNYVMSVFLAAAVHNRFLVPQVHALNKVDLLSREELETQLRWSTSPEELQEDLSRTLAGMGRVMSENIIQAVLALGVEFSPIPVSAKTADGLVDLYAELERALGVVE